MATPRARMPRMRTAQWLLEGESLERPWDAGVCRGCGAIVVLREQAGGVSGDLCAAGQTLPMTAPVSLPVAIRLEATPAREAPTAPTLAGARVRDAA